MKPFQFLLIAIALGLTRYGNAQSDTIIKQKPQFKLSLNYNSALNYYGRTDDLRSSGFFPLAEFWFNKNFYISAAPVFVTNAVKSFDYAGTVGTVGYLKSTEKMITNLYLTKPFYEENTQLVQSALKAQTGLNLSFLNKFVNVTMGGDIKFSDEIDFGANAGLDHIIRKQLKNQAVFVFDPSAYIYAGTQNFTTTYYKKKTSLPLFPGNSEQVTETDKKFDVLAYEFSAPLVYAKGKWMFMVTPSYILPQNLVAVPNHPELSESGKNMFYTTLTAKHTF
jgi:hypothetical protein